MMHSRLDMDKLLELFVQWPQEVQHVLTTVEHLGQGEPLDDSFILGHLFHSLAFNPYPDGVIGIAS